MSNNSHISNKNNNLNKIQIINTNTINNNRHKQRTENQIRELISEKRNDELVTEKHYGCYRVGVLISLIIIFILILGCVPVFIGSEDSKLILTVLIICMIVAGLLTFAYFEFQRRRAVHMRQNSVRGTYSTIERRSKEQQKYVSIKKKQEEKMKNLTTTTKYSPV